MFYFVKIQSTYYLHLQNGLDLFTKIFNLWPKFTHFCNPMLKIWKIRICGIQDYSLIHTIKKFQIPSQWYQLKPTLRVTLSDFYRWDHECSLRKKCPYSELFWSAFSIIRTEYGEILCISPYSVRLRENAEQINSKYGHFLRSGSHITFSVNTFSCASSYLKYQLSL